MKSRLVKSLSVILALIMAICSSAGMASQAYAKEAKKAAIEKR